MNKRQKEVAKVNLKAEQQVLRNLKAVYKKSASDCAEKAKILLGEGEATQSKIYQARYQQALEKQLNDILDKMNSKNYKSISEYLKDCYTDSFVGNVYDLHGQGVPLILPINQEQIVNAIQLNSKISEGLYKRMGKDTKLLKKQIKAQISRGISNGSSYLEIARNLNAKADIGYNKASRIVRTEGHRIQSESRLDSMGVAKEKGADIVKQWDSTLDGATRPTHRQLDGQIREINDDFEINGRKVSAPGHFNDPAEDCNCRCALLQRARWALDEDELEELKKRAEYFGLDKTKDFEDFKEKYLRAAETVDKFDKSDIIKIEEVNALEQAKKRDHKIYITDVAIDKVGNVRPIDFSEKQAEQMQVKHKELLKIAKEKNDSNEVLFIDDLNFKSEVQILGEEFVVSPGKNPFAVSIVNNAAKQSLIYLHNHPSTNNFSMGDIDTFICESSIKMISAVTNQGEVYILNKTSQYDYNKVRKLLLEIYNSFPEGEIDDKEMVSEFLKRCYEGGIEYAKSK